MNKATHYGDQPRQDLLDVVPPDGLVIGSVGCATGATEAVLVRAGRQVHGVDVNALAIDVAKERLTTARVVNPGELRPFAADSLDGLILADVLEHIPEGPDALAAFAEAVRPGGWVMISVPNMLYLDALRVFLLHDDWPEEQVGIFDRTHIHFMTRRRLSRWCTDAGLKPVAWHDKYHPQRPRRDTMLDRLTFRVAHRFLTYQWLVTCRRDSSAATGYLPPLPIRRDKAGRPVF